jgi:hypothetical protein
MTDDDRIALSAVWADQAYGWLAEELNEGRIVGKTDEARQKLDTLCDGLRVLADNLGVVSYPFPPATVRPGKRILHLVK